MNNGIYLRARQIYFMMDWKRRTPWLMIGSITILFLLGVPLVAGELMDNENSSQNSSALVLIYMVGSDLESGNGHPGGGGDGTADIMKILNGYGSATPESLNIVVAYGGAAVPGWDGMTIATITDLQKDAADGIIGNEGIGELRDPSADMGSPAALQKFLSYAKSSYTGNTTYLVFWNHGGGFEGFGWDENSGSHLSVSDIAGSLKENGVQYDLIGFDACLMNGIEVAQSIEPYAHYMLGSEEISAGGWSYEKWIPTLAEHPDQDAAETGRTIVKTFIEQDEPLGNTGALIDLTRIQLVIDRLGKLGTTLDGTLIPESSVLPIARAYEKTTRFGENSGDSPGPGMIDLGTLAGQLSTSVPEAQQATEDLRQALADAVVYERHDDLMSNATGLSIADPLTISTENYEKSADILSIGPEWDRFVEDVRNQMKTSFAHPDMVSIGTNTYQITEPTGSESVSVVYFAVLNGTEEILQLGTMPLDPDDNGSYVLPDWDGKWYYLQDSADPEQTSLIDLYYGDTTTTGIDKYVSEVDVTRNGTLHNTVMYTYVDPDTEWNRFSLRPYQVKDNETVFARNGLTPQAGDTLRTYASAYDANGNDAGLKALGTLNITGSLNITSGTLPDGDYGWALMVTSPDGQQDIGDMKLMTISNGTVTDITSDALARTDSSATSENETQASEQNKSSIESS